MPPVLDAVKLSRLAELADRLDGALPGYWEAALAEFNRLADTSIPIGSFQHIYEAENHKDWVRRLLYRQVLSPTVLSREEMTEIVSRVMFQIGDPDYDFYLELFRANCQHPSGTDLIFWPNLVPELPQGREPIPEEVAESALRPRPGANPNGE
jgi:hypothetical protein